MQCFSNKPQNYYVLNLTFALLTLLEKENMIYPNYHLLKNEDHLEYSLKYNFNMFVLHF